VTPVLKLRIGIHAMVRFTTRVAAMAAVAVLLLQAACTMGFASGSHLEAAAPAESGCHETAPATPTAPDRGQVCCGGDHSPDVLLSAVNNAAIPMASQMLHFPTLDLPSPNRLFAATAGPSSGPPVPFALRI